MLEMFRIGEGCPGKNSHIIGGNQLHAGCREQGSNDFPLLQMRKHVLSFRLGEVFHHESRFQDRPIPESSAAHGFFHIPFVGPVFLPPIASIPAGELGVLAGFAY
ncbi:hypothetical protein D9M69_619930 [compost metagenome]